MLAKILHRDRRQGEKETRLDVWLRGLKSPDGACVSLEEIERKCLATDELDVTRLGVLVRGIHFTHDALAYYITHKVIVRSNLDGEPKYVIALLKGHEVQLFRNVNPDIAHVSALKDTAAQNKAGLLQIQKTLEANSLTSLGYHSPGTATAIKEKKKTPSIPNRPAPVFSIPDLQTKPFPSAQ